MALPEDEFVGTGLSRKVAGRICAAIPRGWLAIGQRPPIAEELARRFGR